MYISSEEIFNLFKVRSKNGKYFEKRFKKIIHTLKCDSCQNTFERSGCQIDRRRLTNKYKHFCQNCHNPTTYADLGRAKYKENLRKHIGERKIDSLGYVRIYIGDTHLYSKGYGGAIREHIYVMENHLGRVLEKGEVVHHIDGDKTNNNIDNLDICTVKEHNTCHATSEKIVFELYKKGIVGYDRKAKNYYLKMAM